MKLKHSSSRPHNLTYLMFREVKLICAQAPGAYHEGFVSENAGNKFLSRVLLTMKPDDLKEVAKALDLASSANKGVLIENIRATMYKSPEV